MEGAWHLQNSAVAYKGNGLGVESLKMVVTKLMEMHRGSAVDHIIGRSSTSA